MPAAYIGGRGAVYSTSRRVRKHVYFEFCIASRTTFMLSLKVIVGF